MMHDENPKEYPIRLLVKFGEVSFQAYYKWLKRQRTINDQFNELLVIKIKKGAYASFMEWFLEPFPVK